MPVVSPRSSLARLLLAALLVPGVGVVATLTPTSSAWAQSAPVFEGQGLVEMLPPSGLVGDGASTADIYVLALTPAGTPLTGLKGKPTVTAGTATDLAEQGGGLYKFSYTPAKATARQDVTFTLKAKTAAKEQISRTWTVSVAAPTSHPVTVAVNPSSITLGQDKTATVSITLQGADSIAAANADLRVNVTAGTITNLTNLGNGQFSALYTAPAEMFPRIAMITVSDRHDPSRSYGGLALPLVGKADFPVSVTPNARVIIKVGGREFGPVQADASGKAKVPIIVPPGATGASLVQIGADGKATESPLDLKIPEKGRIALFPTTAAVPGDGSVSVPVRALVVTPDGKPDGNAQVTFTASTGTISAARHEGGGVYVANYTPANALYEGTVGITVSLEGGSKEQVAKTDLKLLPMRASKIDLAANPTTLQANTDSFGVKATVTGAAGTALPGRTVTFTADGAKLRDVKDLKNGTYEANFTTTGSGPAAVAAMSGVNGGGNPLSRVILVPSRKTVPNDGLSSASFLVVTVDDYGYPVASQGVSLKLLTGDGSLPATITTGTDGTAMVTYTAGRKNGLVSVEAASGGTVASASLVQVQAGVAVPDLPPGGPRAVTDVVNAWSSAIGMVKLDRAGATGMAAPVTAAPVVAAAPATTSPATTLRVPMPGGTVPAKVQMVSDPAAIAPGTSVALRIVLTDAAGKGVGGQSLDFLTSAGTVTSVNEVGSGLYTAVLSVPGNVSGEVKVSVATREGDVSSFVRVPVGTATAAAAPVTAAPVAAAPVTAAPVVTVPGKGPETSAEAWGGADTTARTAEPTPAPTTSATPTPATTSAAPSAAPTMAPAPTTTEKAPKAEKPPKATATADGEEGPSFRLRAGLMVGSYNYNQTILAQNSSLFPTDVPYTTGTQGLALNARYFLPNFRYVGAEVGVSAGHYALDPTSLCAYLGRPCDGTGAVSDWVTNVHVLGVGRYAFDSGSSMYWGGARVGFGYGDIEGIQATTDTLDFPQFRVNSLAIGAELGAEFMDGKLFLNPSLTEYLAGGSSPYDTSFAFEVGYGFTDSLYASLTYDLSARKVSVLNSGNNKVGEISDTTNAVTLSLGMQM